MSKTKTKPEIPTDTFTRTLPVGTLEYSGNFHYHCFWVPEDVAAWFRERSISRLLLEVGGKTSRKALLSDGQGGYYMIISREMLKTHGLAGGGSFAITLMADPEPDELDICEEMAEVLTQDVAFAERWSKLTQGRKRGYLHWVNSGKVVETRIKRALDLAGRYDLGKPQPRKAD